MSSQTNKETPSVNDTTDRDIFLGSIQYGIDFPRILQAIWEVDPEEGPVRVSKLDVTDAYHRGTLQLSQVGTFSYAIPSVPDYDVIIICIDLILLMGWVDSPKFLCAFLATFTGVANTIVGTYFPVLAYRAISVLPNTEPIPPKIPDSLTNIYCYMDDVISAVQGGVERQHRVFDSTFSALKCIST